MEVIEKDVLSVTIKFSLDEARALQKSLEPGKVSASDLRDIQFHLDRLAGEINALDCKLAREKEESVVLLKNIREDLERL